LDVETQVNKFFIEDLSFEEMAEDMYDDGY
jgi:hypothetical protein